jgi:hypothetical protein
MQKFRLGFAGLCVFALLLPVAAAQATPQDANFAGTWEMTMTGGGQGGGGGNQGGGSGNQGGGGANRGGGRGEQSLTIMQDGDKVKISHKTRRGETASDATVSGNTISWTEQRQGRGGATMKIDYKATLNGDTMKGTMGGGQFSRDFTAKRSN